MPVPSLPSTLSQPFRDTVSSLSFDSSPNSGGTTFPILPCPIPVNQTASPGPSPVLTPNAPLVTRSPKRSPTTSRADADTTYPSKRRAPSSVTTKSNPYSLRSDRLGTLACALARDLETAESWESFVHSFRGCSYLAEVVGDLPHPAAKLLASWRDNGVPAKTSAEP